MASKETIKIVKISVELLRQIYEEHFINAPTVRFRDDWEEGMKDYIELRAEAVSYRCEGTGWEWRKVDNLQEYDFTGEIRYERLD